MVNFIKRWVEARAWSNSTTGLRRLPDLPTGRQAGDNFTFLLYKHSKMCYALN